MKIGVLGTGNIVRSITATLKKMSNMECYAIASRTAEQAEQAAKEFGYEKAYGNYEELVGGALLDVGVYGINFALMHFGGDIERMESSVQMTDTGVDGMESITLHYKGGRMAVLTHGIYGRSDRKGIFYGSEGYMVVENINNPQSVSVYDQGDNLVKHITVPEQITGYEYQFEEAAKCIAAGKIESDSMPLCDSITVMEVMDGLRKQWGLVYPQERKK